MSTIDTLHHATEAVQAMERLYLELKDVKHGINFEVFQKCMDCLDDLKSIKSSLEGSEVKVKAPEVKEDFLVELKQLTLMHIPSSMEKDVCLKFQDLIQKTFEGTGVDVVYACLLTCPWYACTQQERGEQAKYNTLFVVYQSSLRSFCAPVSSHVVEKTSIVDKEWLYGCELFHFVQSLCKGRTRNVEALHCPEPAVIYQTEAWKQLGKSLHYKYVTGLRCYLEACRGQAVGGIGKKGKDGKFRLADGTTFRQLCDSFRLMNHAYNSVKGFGPCTYETSPLPDVGKRAMAFMQSMYQNPDVSKKDAFTLLLEWYEQFNKEPAPVYSKPEEVQGIVGDWHMQMRLHGRPLSLSRVLPDDLTEMCSLMEKIGGPVSNLDPAQIVLITQAGSFMYGLSTPTSDVDYLVIYAEKTEKYLTACKKLPESFESRGPTKQIEYGAYEIRCFAEMVLKGSVVILELLYKDGHNYMSPAWTELSSQRDRFVSETAIQQYMGLVKNNLHMIKREKHKDMPQERKLFYQIYHKLASVEYLLQGKTPPVRCSGPIKDFIMRVRTQPLEVIMNSLEMGNHYLAVGLRLDVWLAQ
ncbi:hypothetical protein DPMN_027148 [Dreissena polymorpha]|uniref:Uncharacterized protein n=1 Tax=Dreissena polymorpha TaxID=45954 RepID=A0A9D4RF87_DREPO|nr:hypothetical protein DPMN_027148 [Dreissena polymorpha]